MTGHAIPPWRRIDPNSASAKLFAFTLVAGTLLIASALVTMPLLSQWQDASDRATRLDQRAAALTAAAAARVIEAQDTQPDVATLERAEVYLATHAPIRPGEAALLDLISSLRLIAGATEVNLASVTPLDGRAGGFVLPLDTVGLSTASAEARITTDHAGLVRFLSALEATQPTLHAVTLDITARSSAASAEDDRLSVSIVVSALSRAEGGE